MALSCNSLSTHPSALFGISICDTGQEDNNEQPNGFILGLASLAIVTHQT